MDIGRIGIWSGPLRRAEEEAAARAAAEIERLGFGAAWLPSGPPGQLDRVRALLRSTRTLPIVTGILNIYTEPDPQRTAESFAALERDHPGRVLLGLGVGHPEVVNLEQPGRYRPPIAAISDYLDGLDRAPQPVPTDRRLLAALGPRMLRLAARRTLGAHPYLTTPEHTRLARQELGAGRLLAPEQTVVLETDPARAREVGRRFVSFYLGTTNYGNNLRRLGFRDEDLAGSDRIIDALVAWGDEETVLRRVEDHHRAGADHVCLQVLSSEGEEFPFRDWARLAAAWR
jgi:probable F420-dependent oxidoreductase